MKRLFFIWCALVLALASGVGCGGSSSDGAASTGVSTAPVNPGNNTPNNSNNPAETCGSSITDTTALVGGLDNSFGNNGLVITDINGAYDSANTVAIQTDGKILVTGDTALSGPSSPGPHSGFATVRYNINGTLDSSFGTNGKVTVTLGSGSAARSIAVQPNGKIIVAGGTVTTTDANFALVRFNIDGTLDNTFGVSGKTITPTGNPYAIINSIAIQSDGKIVAGGSNILTRYNVNGTIDVTFGTSGLVTVPTGNISAITLQLDGKIIAVGGRGVGGSSDFFITRYSTNGTIDNTFGSSGQTTTSVVTGDDAAYAVTIQPDGKIIAAGEAQHVGSSEFTLIRYNTDGSVDDTFGNAGIMTSTLFRPSHNHASSVAIQPNGMIVVAGGSNETGYDFALERFNVSGSLDTQFGVGGVIITEIGDSSSSMIKGIAIQPDGKIVAAGLSDDDFVIARYLSAGTNAQNNSSCDFNFSSISNGASSNLANSYWDCSEVNGGTSTNYKLVFFDDGSGATSGVGFFSWNITGCGEAEATTSQGTIGVSNISGSFCSSTLTFRNTYQNGTSTQNSCTLHSLSGTTPTENDVTPPPAIPSLATPTGSGTNDAVLSTPVYAGTLYSVWATNGQFLGTINANPFDPNSLCNAFGNYGSRFSQTSVWNQFSNYGSNFATYSAFNNFTSTPPIIFANTQPLAYLSTNSILAPRLDSTYLLNLMVAAGCNISR